MNERERAAWAICARLRAAGHRALFAGGCVRDRLLGITPKDFDVATSALPDQVAALFPRTIAVGAAFGVILVQTEAGPVEVATFRHDGPYLDGRHPSAVTFTGEREDAARRDFTINALYLDPETDTVLDYVDGLADLRARVVRAVGDPAARFREDHLRLLRAVRFAARLDFSIGPRTLAAIREHAPLCIDTSAERVRDELLKMLTEGHAKRAFELLDETGLLEHVLPEMIPMKGCEQPPEYHPEGDVFVHTLLLLDQLGECSPALALAALLHDVGKPPTQTFEDRIRFNLHEKVGARMAEKICKRLRLPNDVSERAVWLVENHMRLAATPEMRESKRKRFVREPGYDELLALGRMDCLASHGDTSHINWIEEYRANLKPDEIRPAPLITGNDLIAMGYPPGPRFKEILTAVEDLQLEGRLETPEAARAHVEMTWPQ
jgi:poly(A) polymerase